MYMLKLPLELSHFLFLSHCTQISKVLRHTGFLHVIIHIIDNFKTFLYKKGRSLNENSCLIQFQKYHLGSKYTTSIMLQIRIYCLLSNFLA